jgi:hypothetical protein
MKSRTTAIALIALFALAAPGKASARPSPSEISVDLKLDETDYVCRERIRGVVDIKNMSPDKISVGYANSKDLLFVEVFKASDMSQLEETKRRPFVSAFRVESNEGQKLETFLGDHYGLDEPRRYLARPVLVHDGYRFEGQYRAFDIVPGMKIATAVQMFSNRSGVRRVFDLLQWTRKGCIHLFLAARDEGGGDRTWMTTDIGPTMKLTKPTISIMSGGEVIVIHRNGGDSFVRSEFWSLPDALDFRSREMISDPETAAQNRVKQIYNERGGVKPADRPWWKFW